MAADNERIRKLGEYENDDLDVGPNKFATIYDKYETGSSLRNNPASYLSRHVDEGTTYKVSQRLERFVQELAQRIGL